MSYNEHSVVNVHTHTNPELAGMYECITVNTHTHTHTYTHTHTGVYIDTSSNKPFRVNQLSVKLNVKMLKMSQKFSFGSQFFCDL